MSRPSLLHVCIFIAVLSTLARCGGDGKDRDADVDADADTPGDPDALDDAAEPDIAPPDGAEDIPADDGIAGEDLDLPPETDAPPPLNECDAMQPAWVFCSGFEEGSKDIWDDYDGNPDETNLLMEDPGPFGNPGNHVMRLRVPPGRGGADLVKVLPGTYDRAYARWYVLWEPGYDFNAPNHGGGLHAGSRDLLGRSDYRPEGDDWFGAWIEPMTDLHVLNAYSYYRGMYMDCADPYGSCWGDHFPCMIDEGEVYCEKPQHRETVMPPVLEAGRWYCIEMMMDGGTPVTEETGADGRLDFWVDGLEIGPWTDLWLRTTPNLMIGILWLSLFHHEEHSVEGQMLDNVVVSTERIGCL
jgi:hypothetical protein